MKARYGLEFTRLITITNLPLGRFLDDLRRKGEDTRYWRLLKESFNAQTIEGLMCRHQLHVGFDGTMYDCDFNCALSMPAGSGSGTHIRDFGAETFVCRHIAGLKLDAPLAGSPEPVELERSLVGEVVFRPCRPRSRPPGIEARRYRALLCGQVVVIAAPGG